MYLVKQVRSKPKRVAAATVNESEMPFFQDCRAEAIQRVALAERINQTNTNVIQPVWIDEDQGTGLELTDEQYSNIMRLIDRYDVILSGADFGRGSGELSAEQIQIGVALTELKAYLISQFKNEKMIKILFGGIMGKGKSSACQGSFATALEVAQGGGQCHNDVADWLRSCLNGLKHYPDEEEASSSSSSSAGKGPANAGGGSGASGASSSSDVKA